MDDIANVTSGRIIQLGQVIDSGLSHGPGVPDFSQHLYGWHRPDVADFENQWPGVSGASDSISMSTHSGTHMDSLSHISVDGVLHDGTRTDAEGVQSEAGGVRLGTRENFSPIVSRGILYDFPRFLGVDVLPKNFVIGLEELRACGDAQGIDVQTGDTVLFRTGYDTITDQPERYLGDSSVFPGPNGDVARLLAERGVVSTGSDTMPYESVPGDPQMVGHVVLLVQHGIFIYEMLDLRELSAAGVNEFLFVVAPLRLRGGTGSPVNPLAIIPVF